MAGRAETAVAIGEWPINKCFSWNVYKINDATKLAAVTLTTLNYSIL